ncbi:hypothetical protein KFK09_020119 [Dendrobium nobile]|uniref:Uncharacterized protein n=1 Tax=Dendrobium nobile TaxID=94219 RepID=A0A8T3ARF0_DENNO|nr:hypothetical protein KFK09_020119 [Dendrobium nobile]
MLILSKQVLELRGSCRPSSFQNHEGQTSLWSSMELPLFRTYFDSMWLMICASIFLHCCLCFHEFSDSTRLGIVVAIFIGFLLPELDFIGLMVDSTFGVSLVYNALMLQYEK